MQTPDVPAALALAEAKGVPVPLFETSYFLSRETVVPTPGSGMVAWRERLFAAMSRNASGVVEFFRLPGNAAYFPRVNSPIWREFQSQLGER
jgi:KUP system potassium uptake protein